MLRLRRLLSRVPRAPDSEYQAGFLTALEMVASGYARGQEHAERVDADVVAVRTRKHWAEILSMLAEKVMQPSEIAARLEIAASQVTKLLDELEEAGLVAHAEKVEATDGRTKPRRLTPRARLVVKHLPGKALAHLDEIVTAVVHCMAHLITRGRGSRATLRDVLEQDLGSGLAAVALDALTKALAGNALATMQQDESIVAPSIGVQASLDRLLRRALQHNDKEFPLKLADLSHARPLLLRVANQRDEWDVLVEKYGLRNVSVLRDDDMRDPPADGFPDGYDVLYECAPLVAVDRRTAPGSRLIDGAGDRHVLCTELDVDLPNFAPLDILPFIEKEPLVEARP